MRFLRSTRKCHFRWLLYLKKKYYNKKRKQQLEDKGYTFIDINEFNKLRHIEDCEGFQWDKSKTTNSIHLQNNKILTKTQRISTSKKRTSSRNKRILHETMCNDDTRNTQKHKKRRLSNIHSE